MKPVAGRIHGPRDFGTFAAGPGEETPRIPAIWQQVGYDRAQAGVRQLGSYFDLSPEELGAMGEVALYAHITRPEQDPVITEAFNWLISAEDQQQAAVALPDSPAGDPDGDEITRWGQWTERCIAYRPAQSRKFWMGMTQSGSMHVGCGGGSGLVNVQDMSITKYLDSPKFAREMDPHPCDELRQAAWQKEAEAAGAESAASEARRMYEECWWRWWREHCGRQAEEHVRYLLENIRDLNLIVYPGFFEIPGLWDWMPGVLAAPVSYGVEDYNFNVIPTDTIKALAGLYAIAATLLEPCTQADMLKTIERLEERTNPHTGQDYTLNEAIDKTDDMCTLLRRLKSRVEQAHAAPK